jgi:hypothetical protein
MDEAKSSKSSHSRKDSDRDHHGRKRHRRDRGDDGKKHKKRKEKSGGKIVDEDLEEDMWVEKNIDMDGDIVRGFPSSHSSS